MKQFSFYCSFASLIDKDALKCQLSPSFINLTTSKQSDSIEIFDIYINLSLMFCMFVQQKIIINYVSKLINTVSNKPSHY